MSQFLTINLSKSPGTSWGFRLQGGKDFAQPLCIQKVNVGSIAAGAGLQAGDAIVSIGSADALTLRHKEAQDTIVKAGQSFPMVIQRGAMTWKPQVTALSQPKKTAEGPVATQTSLAANQPAKAVVNPAYNTPINLYNEDNIAEALSSQSEVLGKGCLGINFRKFDREVALRTDSPTYQLIHGQDAAASGGFKPHKPLPPQQEASQGEKPVFPAAQPGQQGPVSGYSSPVPCTMPAGSTRSVQAPVTKPRPEGQAQTDATVCTQCEKPIIGVFVRIKDKNLHADCFKCNTCGSSLKNVGYYNINDKMYCDVHAKQAARHNPPGPNMVPVTVNPGTAAPFGAMPAAAVKMPVQVEAVPPVTTEQNDVPYAVEAPQTSELEVAQSESSEVQEPVEFHEPVEVQECTLQSTGRSAEVESEKETAAQINHEPETQLSNDIAEESVTQEEYQYSSVVEENSATEFSGELQQEETKDQVEESAEKAEESLEQVEVSNEQAEEQAEETKEQAQDSESVAVIQDNVQEPELSLEIQSNVNEEVQVDEQSKLQETPPTTQQEVLEATPVVLEEPTQKQQIGLEPISVTDELASTFVPAPGIVSGGSSANPAAFGAPSGGVDVRAHIPKKGPAPAPLYAPAPAPVYAPAPAPVYAPAPAPAPAPSFITPKPASPAPSFITPKPAAAPAPSFITPKPATAPAPAPSFIAPKPVAAPASSPMFGSIPMPKPGPPPGIGSIGGILKPPGMAGKGMSGERTAPKRGKGVMTPAHASRIPICAGCQIQIRGPFVTALGKNWCPDHFHCATESCRKPLIDVGFVEELGKLHCEDCYEKYLAPTCGKCDKRIKGDCLNAVGKQFHPECFCCAYCGKVFGSGAFYLEDGLPYCETDWNDLFTTKCVGCGFPIEAGDRWVEALNNNYHSQCFKCSKCHKNLEGQSFFAKGGKPFCKSHAQRGF